MTGRDFLTEGKPHGPSPRSVERINVSRRLFSAKDSSFLFSVGLSFLSILFLSFIFSVAVVIGAM